MKINYKPKYYYTDYTKKYYEKGTFYNNIKPTLVTIKPTLNCVANCFHCNPRSKRFTRERVMTLEEYNELFKKLKKLGTQQICISGGEPLIYKDIVKLVELITKNGMKASLNTNGWLLNTKKFVELMNAGLLMINLSIDYPNSKQHDEFRRLNGLFEKAVSQIKECKNLNIPFKLNIRMVLSKYNYKQIGDMIKLAIDLNADILSIDMIEADSKNKLFLLNKNEIEELKQVYIPKLKEQIQKLDIKKELKDYNIKQLEDIFNTAFNPVENFENGIYWPDQRIKEKCDIPSSFMIIEGDGMVLPCNAVEYNRQEIIGNIFDIDIEKLWNSEKWNNFRKYKMDFCVECPMNMSYMLVFDDNEIFRNINIDELTSEKVKNMIKIDKNNDYEEERLQEYIKYFKKDKNFIEKIEEKYPIASLEYKVDFLYPNFFNSMKNNEEIFNSYGKASEYYSLRQLLGRPNKFEKQIEIFNIMNEKLCKNATVIDYGCCVGDFSILFANMGFDVYAFDLDIETLNFAEQRFKDRNLNIKVFRVKENMKIPTINKKADFVFCRDVLEHTVDPINVLQYFYDNLNEKGYMYTSTMNPGEEIYIGAEHLENTIKQAKTEEYKKFFDDHFESLGIHGLYRKK